MTSPRSSGALALVLLASCGAPAGQRPDAPEAPRVLLSNGGGFRVEFELRPDPVPLNEPFGLEARVFVPADSVEPDAGVELRVDAAMPEHGHGMVREPRLERGPEGLRRVDGLLFHMPGRWELYFDVTRAGRTERAQLELRLR